MHLEDYVLTQISEALEKSKKIGVIPSKFSEYDSYCAACGLVQLISEKFPEKEIVIVWPNRIPDGCESFVRKEQIKSNVYERTLEVSIDYSTVRDAKVNYTTTDDVLTLFLGPVEKNFDLTNVKASLHGFNFDLLITLGVSELDDLGQIHQELREDFDTAQVINVDNTERNKRFGYVNVIDNTAPSLSNLVFNMGYKLGLSPNQTAAMALLQGMAYEKPKF